MPNVVCNWCKKNTRFSVWLFFFVAVIGTGFSIDKSIDIYRYNEELTMLRQKNSDLSSELDKLSDKLNSLESDFKRSSYEWNKEKIELLERQKELTGKSKK